MNRALSGVLLSVGFVAAGAAQAPVGPPSKTPPQPATLTREAKVPLTVQGCVYDKRLKWDDTLGINRPALALAQGDEFVLEGPKELMRQLKAYHDGHEELISGVVTIPPQDDRDALTTTKRVGPKTTVTADTSQLPARDDKKPDNSRVKHFLRLKVEEVRHVQDKCPFPF